MLIKQFLQVKNSVELNFSLPHFIANFVACLCDWSRAFFETGASFEFVVLNFSPGPTVCAKLLGQEMGGRGGGALHVRQWGEWIVSRPDGRSVWDLRQDISGCSTVPWQSDVDNLAAGSTTATVSLVQQAPRAGALQRVDDTMVGFRVDDVVGNAK